MDLSKKAVMVSPGQKPGAFLVRPSLPAQPGVKTCASESKNSNLTCDTEILSPTFCYTGCRKCLYIV